MRLVWSSHRGDDCLRVTGWPAGAAHSLRVYPTELIAVTLRNNLEPLAGHTYVDASGASFVPRFPFVAGMSYTVMGTDVDDVPPLTITRPANDHTPATRVLEIYPTATELPRNHLRLYAHFSAPMSEGYVESHVRVVLADTREPLEGAFLPTEPELWDRDRRRVTILFDPARIKRGLAPHQDAGYPLKTDVSVEVVIDEGFADAEGRPLLAGYARRYRVGADVRARVDPKTWTVERPPVATLAPVRVHFDRPLDHALLQHCLVVLDALGNRVSGLVTVPVGERSWEFTPTAPWPRQTHVIVVDAMLEDLAGNSLRRVFDRDLGDPDHMPDAVDHAALEFVPS
jgi:hypothetical protein